MISGRRDHTELAFLLFIDMKERQILSEKLNAEFAKWRKINRCIDRVLLTILLFLIMFIGAGLVDDLVFLEEGINSVKYHSFEELLAINPDTAAWLTMDGTHIDHPVVRTDDNFEYLDKGFDGRFYAGGTLFMDEHNDCFEEPYCIIHGHHMAGGAMFGDLEKYIDKGFFEKNSTGKLLTPEYDYDITVAAAGIFDAYDASVYGITGEIPKDYIREKSMILRKTVLNETDHMLILSTCTDDMSDNRTVIFCRLSGKRKHL